LNRPLVVTAILLSMFLSAMEATVVSTAMPTVVSELRGIELYGWVGAIYMLATTVTIPVWGKLADVIGRKPIMIAGLLVFLAGSIGCGFASSMLFLVIMRALQGIGAGALQPVALTIVGDLFTIEERGRIQGVFGAVWGVAGMVGPLVGGFVVAVASWRWVFFLNLPFGLLSGGLLLAFYREQRGESLARKPIDVLGAVLLSGAVMALLLGVGGKAPLLTLPLSALLLGAFVLCEGRARDPLLPMSLLGRPVIRIASILGGLVGAVMMGVLMYTPLYVQAAQHGSPTAAGTSVAPMLVGWPLASALSTRFLARIGYRPIVRAGFLVIAVSSVAIHFCLSGGGASLRIASFSLGIGMGLANTALLIAVQESVEHRERGVATASTMFFRTIGGAIAVGALGALLAMLLAGKIPEHVLDDLLGPEHGKGLDASLIAQYEGAIAAAMKPIFEIVAGLAGLSFLASLAFPASVTSSRNTLTGAAGEVARSGR
jgi:MFS family permease